MIKCWILTAHQSPTVKRNALHSPNGRMSNLLGKSRRALSKNYHSAGRDPGSLEDSKIHITCSGRLSGDSKTVKRINASGENKKLVNEPPLPLGDDEGSWIRQCLLNNGCWRRGMTLFWAK
jgi:hypothetical protein